MTSVPVHHNRPYAAMGLLTLMSACGGPGEEPASLRYQPPFEANLLLISIDTTRADHLGCYGYPEPTTPNLDQVATAGVLFREAFTVMPTTLPAHTSLFTSQYPRQTGVQSNLGNVATEEVTLAEQLSAAGVLTAGFASSRVLASETGLGQGFAEYKCAKRSTWKANHTCGLARQWMVANKASRFFCFVHLYDPHVGYDPPARQREAFEVHGQEALPPLEQLAFMADPPGLTPALAAQVRSAYDAEIAFVDAQIGALLRTMRAHGLSEKTVVVVTSDHGETLDELAQRYGYAYDHGEFLYPRELRVPLLFLAPDAFGFAAGQRIADAVSILDLMPTLLDLMGLACPDHLEGRSLVPLLAGGGLPPTTIVAERHSYQTPPNDWMEGDAHAVIRQPYLFLRSEGRGTELFDLERDPQGLTDLLSAEPEQAVQLDERLQRWLETRLPKDSRLAPEAAGSERDQAMKGLGYADGG